MAENSKKRKTGQKDWEVITVGGENQTYVPPANVPGNKNEAPDIPESPSLPASSPRGAATSQATTAVRITKKRRHRFEPVAAFICCLDDISPAGLRIISSRSHGRCVSMDPVGHGADAGSCL